MCFSPLSEFLSQSFPILSSSSVSSSTTHVLVSAATSVPVAANVSSQTNPSPLVWTPDQCETSLLSLKSVNPCQSSLSLRIFALTLQKCLTLRNPHLQSSSLVSWSQMWDLHCACALWKQPIPSWRSKYHQANPPSCRWSRLCRLLQVSAEEPQLLQI